MHVGTGIWGMWLAINCSDIWNRVLKAKYLRKLSIADWISKEEHTVQNALIIWNGFLRVLGLNFCVGKLGT